ncbi:sporulation initiation phosphotransferase F [bacterium BMS3Abin07]|nr:sporulation initiation phosphotransferase F [bacterium BMS3Abin07]GBE32028.1 sporulation initiation phosphotransferase F [bacterium BMS3Bbin05]HDL20579.1 response regulator [Nitrospirota bacterium]HDO22294.1 response regulator [Nitrospirota bacterium]HDZ88713.1 response regulator [Nitrospirota bacterium]
MKVLVIDDEKLVRWFLERALRKWNHNVTSASDGNKAIDLLKSNSYDIVFTDLKMPAADGSSVIEYLNGMANTPSIIVCSAYITPEMEDDFRNRGLLALKKPFKLEELEDIMKKITTLNI